MKGESMPKHTKFCLLGILTVLSGLAVSSCNAADVQSIINVLTSSSAAASDEKVSLASDASSQTDSSGVISTSADSTSANSTIVDSSKSSEPESSSVVQPGSTLTETALKNLFSGESLLSYDNFSFQKTYSKGTSLESLQTVSDNQVKREGKKLILTDTFYPDTSALLVHMPKFKSDVGYSTTSYCTYDDNFFLAVTESGEEINSEVYHNDDFSSGEYKNSISSYFDNCLSIFSNISGLDFEEFYAGLAFDALSGQFSYTWNMKMSAETDDGTKGAVALGSQKMSLFFKLNDKMKFQSLEIQSILEESGSAAKSSLAVTDIGTTTVTIPDKYSLANLATVNFYYKSKLTYSRFYLLNTSVGSSVYFQVDFNDGSNKYILQYAAPENITEKTMSVDAPVSIWLSSIIGELVDSKVTIGPEISRVSEGAFDNVVFKHFSYTSATEFAQNALEKQTNLETVDYDYDPTVKANYIYSFDYMFGSNVDSLTTINLGAGVTSFDFAALKVFKNLSAINIAESNPDYSSVDGVVYSKDGQTLVFVPAGKKIGGSFVIPDGVKVIEAGCFSGSTITSVTLPASIEAITNESFADSQIKTFVVDDGNTSFASDGQGAIYTKDYQTLVRVPFAFEGEFIIPDNVFVINESAFVNCDKITSVTFGKNTSTANYLAFQGCTALADFQVASGNPFFVVENGCVLSSDKMSLYLYPYANPASSFMIPSETNTIPGVHEDIFSSPNLKEITVESGNTAYVSLQGVLYTADKTSLALIPRGYSGELTLPKETTNVYASQFHGNNGNTINIKSINVEEGNTSFVSKAGLLFDANGSFMVCPQGYEGLAIIPETTTDIDFEAFTGCNKVTEILVKCDLRFFNIEGMTALKVLYVTGDIGMAYMAASMFGETSAVICAYSETQPEDWNLGNWPNYWHYVDGSPVIWSSVK
jgi:hypothetical protein